MTTYVLHDYPLSLVAGLSSGEVTNGGRGKTKADFLGQYAEGWSTGDTEKITGACASGFEFHDHERGAVLRADFADYHQAFVDQNGSTMKLTGVISHELGDKLVACCVWEAGTLRGTGLITVGNEGVEREEVTTL